MTQVESKDYGEAMNRRKAISATILAAAVFGFTACTPEQVVYDDVAAVVNLVQDPVQQPAIAPEIEGSNCEGSSCAPEPTVPVEPCETEGANAGCVGEGARG